ncbi:MAG: cyanophycin synthetase [Firmicutes bacterium]|jgi:cyanophycin synthetase|nr:cyanophycin synthetase [Bacillota bacterium]
MRMVDIRVIEGPNVHSRTPVAEMLVHLGAYDGVLTPEIAGFNARILKLIPSLAEHYCSVGRPGGFVERLGEGTLLGHVIEHVALELQALAGAEVFYGKTRASGRRGLYTIVFEAGEKNAAMYAGRASVRLVEAAAKGLEYDVDRCVARVRKLMAAGSLGPSTRAIVEAALKRDIPVMRLNDASLVQLGYGCLQKRVEATLTCLTPGVAIDVAKDKSLAKELLRRSGIPVPDGGVASTQAEAVRIAERIGYPVVVKPLDGNQGKAVSLNLLGRDDVVEAYRLAKAYSGRVIVEKHIPGRHYRLLVVGGKVPAAAERIPAHVVGDGEHSIRQLVEIANADPRRGESHEKPLTRIRIDRVVLMSLSRRGIALDDVPEAGRVVYLRDNSNLSTGGTAIDVTEEVHPENAKMAARAAAVIGLDVAGVDVVAPSICEPVVEGRGAVIEVNAAPGIRMHHYPSHGRARDAGGAIVEHLFPAGSRSRIPIVAVTGTNGKTTVTRMIAHVLAQCGVVTGVTTTDGVFVGGSRILSGDTTGPRSARAVLQDPHVQCAVLETARGGIVKWGLGFDRCDVGVLTNISDDHIGQDGIESLDELARVKSVVLDAIDPGGWAVLNADDPISLSMMERCRCNIILFSMSGENLLVKRHTVAGGAAVVLKKGLVTLTKGGSEQRILQARCIPASLRGRARFNIENALAATAACIALGVPTATIRDALKSFGSDADNPGRLDLFSVGGVKVIVDYAHNVSALRRAAETIRALHVEGRVIGVVTSPGDRRDDAIINLGRTVASGFDFIIIKEDKDLRGRKPGEVASLIGRGVIEAGRRMSDVEVILDEEEAVKAAVEMARPGDLVVVFYEKYNVVVDALAELRRDASRRSSEPAPAAVSREA